MPKWTRGSHATFGLRLCAGLLLALVVVAQPADAQSLTWYLDGWELEDGSTARGRFDVDGITQQITNANIVTSDGPLQMGQAYEIVVSPNGSGILEFVPNGPFGGDLSGQRILRIQPLRALTSDGGAVELGLKEERRCADPNCSQSQLLRSVRLGRIFAPDIVLDEVTYQIDGWTFNDGGTGSGAFSFKPRTLQFEGPELSTTVGTDFSGDFYASPQGSDFDRFLVTNAAFPDTRYLEFVLAESPEPYGNMLDIGSGTTEGTCPTADCVNLEPRRNAIGGRVVNTSLVAEFCQFVPGPNVTNFEIDFPVSGVVLDFDVSVQAFGDFRGKQLRLTGPGIDAGTRQAVDLFTANPALCEPSAMFVDFDDLAPLPIVDQSCAFQGALGGQLRPEGYLSQFNGVQADQDSWNLEIVGTPGEASIDSWCIKARLTAGPAGRDVDADGLVDAADNCIVTPNLDQIDSDGDGLGDACDDNSDGDGDQIDDLADNCPGVQNPGQEDVDGDLLGDACDPCVNDAANDPDGDGVCETDNCPNVANPAQRNFDGDAEGDECDLCPLVNDVFSFDTDNDGIGNECDNCPLFANPGQAPIFFTETIRATDPQTFNWNPTGQTEVVRGAFAQSNEIGQYTFNQQFFGFEDGTFVDATQPAPGTGLWYLARPSCTLGGSYSGGGSGEFAGRDAGVLVCDFDGDGFLNPLCGGNDCSEIFSTVNPSAAEVCNGFDDNCNGQVDEGCPAP